MSVNSNKPHLWKQDSTCSVDFYNEWFLKFAPVTYRKTRERTTVQVEDALIATSNLTQVTLHVLEDNPSIVQILRMATAPPLARDRLIGLSGVTPNLVRSMEKSGRLPPRMKQSEVIKQLSMISEVIHNLVDTDIFTWLVDSVEPTNGEVHRAATIVADRLCGAETNPIIRNAQEQRQLEAIKTWLVDRGYHMVEDHNRLSFADMVPGTFAFRMNVNARQESGRREVNIPIDAVIMPLSARQGDLPLLVEAKSAGDFTNTNKRRKEEATKVTQLRNTYGNDISFILFLCGYFDSGYLGYEAAEGIDWVWEHRIDDLAEFGI